VQLRVAIDFWLKLRRGWTAVKHSTTIGPPAQPCPRLGSICPDRSRSPRRYPRTPAPPADACLAPRGFWL